MDEISGHTQPTENGEMQTADADVISLPRSKFGTVQVLIGFFFIEVINIIAPLIYYTWNVSKYVTPVTANILGPGSLVAIILIIISALSMLFCGLVLCIFPGARRWWIKTAVIVFAFSSITEPLFFSSNSLFGDSSRFWLAWILFAIGTASFIILSSAIWIMVGWLPELRFNSEYRKELFPRKRLTIVCCLAVLYLICNKLGIIITFYDVVFSSHYLFRIEGIILWLTYVLPFVLLVLICVLYAFRKGSIAAAIIAFVILGINLIELAYTVYNPLWGVSVKVSEWILWLLGIVIPQLLVSSYPLVILAILPLRPLGKELFRRVEKKRNRKNKFSYYA